MTAKWNPGAARLAEGVAIGPPPPGWRPVPGEPLVVLVGLTGSGKTTLGRALIESWGATPLPDRRALTDAVILGEAEGALDRAGRFAATARFRERAPGGMGEVLAALSVAAPPRRAFLFDGLRGAAELAFAAAQAAATYFLVLAVSDRARAERIAARGDRFDAIAPGAVREAAAIVAEEAAHYRMEDAIDALRANAAGRFALIDAEAASAADVRAEAEAALDAAFA